ncbi:MAG: hypothetical protein IKZ02_03900 [Alphaproteobacteria bacterium]|nr:hypothetical protein [Alphaproteobacteria bacterium]
MKKISQKINWFLGLIKWPIAVLMLVALVPAFQADWLLIEKSMTAKMLWEFYLPFGVTILFFLIMPDLSGSFFTIAEHELTHMLFAVLTFHKPKGLDIEQGVGGYFSFEGEGNWLVALAPYFFPTFTVALMLGFGMYQQFEPKLPDYWLILFGIFIGYHFIVTLFEIHPKQTDFIVAGPVFTICFIPTANLLMYGMLLAYVLKGWAGIPAYFQLIFQQGQRLLGI